MKTRRNNNKIGSDRSNEHRVIIFQIYKKNQKKNAAVVGQLFEIVFNSIETTAKWKLMRILISTKQVEIKLHILYLVQIRMIPKKNHRKNLFFPWKEKISLFSEKP